MLSSGAPTCLRDDCLELEAYISFHHVNSLYCLNGEVLKMYMSRETTDISQFSELEWYCWTMYCLGTIDYQDGPLCSGSILDLPYIWD